MGITYHKLHRLRRHLTWEELADRLSNAGGAPKGKRVSRVTLHQLADMPHKTAKPHLQAAIDQLHEQTIGTPYPAGANRLLEIYRALTVQTDVAANITLIKNFEAFLHDHLALYPQDDLYQARMLWMMGNIKEDLMRLERNTQADETAQNRRERIRRNEALHYYKRADAILLQQEKPDRSLSSERFKLKQNQFACYTNALFPGDRNQRPDIQKCINDIGIIETADTVLTLEPFQWLTARTALMCVALRKGPNDLTLARAYFEKLVQANRRFLDLNYKPLFYAAIANDTDLKWVVDEVLTPTTLKTISASY